MTLFPLAFGFANAAILGWLAAAAAPILIHLWMKRVRRETPWAAVRFLQAAIKRHSRRLRLQEWILLAIRTAIILLVVLAASKPVLEQLGGLVGAGVRTHHVLVIDASLSMRYQSESHGVILGRAKRLATDYVSQCRSGDSFSLLVMSDPPAALIQSPTTDAASIRNAIARVEPTESTGSVLEALKQASRVLEAADQSVTKTDRAEVVVFSDMTVGSWKSLVKDAGKLTGEIGQTVKHIAEQAEVIAIDVGEPDAQNLVAAALKVTSGAPTLKQPVQLRGAIRFHGPAIARPQAVAVELMVDEVAVASRQLALTPNQSQVVDFRHVFRRPGWRRVALRLPGDGLAIDNQRLASIEVRPYINVLCIEGKRRAARYVADALNPTASSGAPIQVRVVSDTELMTIDFTKFDAVIACNVAEFESRVASRLTEYVRGGGGLTVFLGDRVRGERYNEALTGAGHDKSPFRFVAQVTEQPLLPVVLGELVGQTVSGVDPLDYQHPIVAPFRGRERAGLLTTPVERYVRLSARPNTARIETVIATHSGDPLMMAASVGSGRIVVVATAASLASIDPTTGRPWTAMPAWPSFVPIVRETLRWVTASQQDQASLLVGATLRGSTGSPEEIIRPDKVAENVVTSVTDFSWSYDRTENAGFYAAKPSSGAIQELFAVNIDTIESNLDRVDSASLPQQITVRRTPRRNGDSAPALAQPTGIHHGLLLGALGLVLLETALASWFGRGKV